MNILVLSDLHIGTKDKSGIFGWNERCFIRQIEYMVSLYSIDKIILNGDILELQKYSYEDIYKANRALLTYLRREEFVFIKGNHDIINNFGVKHYQIKNSFGQIIHIEHGHNADWFNGSRFGRTIGKAALLLPKKLAGSERMMRLYYKIIARVENFNRIPKRYNTLKYLTYALKLMKEFDVVILSHTHKLESHHTYYLNKKKRYINSGSCSLGRFEGIIMDTETLSYELIKETSESFLKNEICPSDSQYFPVNILSSENAIL